MFRMCVNNKMLHAGVAVGTWQPHDLPQPDVVGISYGQYNTAVSQAAAGVAPV